MCFNAHLNELQGVNAHLNELQDVMNRNIVEKSQFTKSQVKNIKTRLPPSHLNTKIKADDGGHITLGPHTILM